MDNNIEVFIKRSDKGIEKPYFKVERTFLSRLKRYVGSGYRSQEISRLLQDNPEDTVLIKAADFQDIVELMIFQSDLNSKSDFFNDLAGIFLEQYNDSLNKYLEFRKEFRYSKIVGDSTRTTLAKKYVSGAVFRDEIDSLKEFIESMMNLMDTTFAIYKQRDLTSAKDLVLDSLSYILNPQEVIQYREHYEMLLSEQPLDLNKIELYLRDLQKIILDDWKSKVTPVEAFKPGDNFRFICHSTTSTSFDGDFFSNLISCSLLTEEFTETYRAGYGFMFSPEDIIGADGDDMYVNNYVDNADDMFTCSTVPKITALEKVLEICRQHREENKKNGDDSKVYSEVVIQGFRPIGIFCLTVGEKTLNYNYRMAKRLHEKFPDLPFIEIDLTLYKTKEELIAYRNVLILKIENCIHEHATKKDDAYYDLYEYFWENYLKLKQTGDYEESDIIGLYRENNLLVSMRIEPGVLLSGKYSVEAIRFAIMNNPLYGLRKILSGKFNAYELKKIGDELINFVDNELLIQAIPGLSELVRVIYEVEITNINVELICQNLPITFESIRTVLQVAIDDKVLNNNNELEQLTSQKQVLESTKEEKERRVSDNKKYKEVMNFEYYYHLAHSDYQLIEKQLSGLLSDKETIDIEYRKCMASIEDLTNQQTTLSKHKIINFVKLRQINIALLNLRIKMNALQQTISQKERDIKGLQFCLDDMEAKFKEQTGIKLLSYDKELEIARSKYSFEIEIVEPSEIRELEIRIEKITALINSLLEQNQYLEEIGVEKVGGIK